jgi:NhaP-type Na+/H+ or K+/H+ antiporter
MSLDFSESLLVLGALVAAAAALSGLFRGSILNASVLAVAAGVGLAAIDAVSVDSGSDTVRHAIELALILTLFSDGLFVERELVGRHWGPPARALIIAMPVTMALIALCARVLFPELDWAECFLLGAVLAPTDPVVTSTVVTARRVPGLIRHTLNLESGLNDGLALPLVLFFVVLAEPGGSARNAAFELVGEVAVGALIGLAVAYVAGLALRRIPGEGIAHNYEGVYALGLALFAYGVADVTWGNGLIAAFLAGVGVAVAEHDVPEAFGQFGENVSAIFQAITFFLFGALIVDTPWNKGVLVLLAFIAFALLVARPAAVLLALAGTRLPQPHKIFIAWFGPKGVASMLFALLVLNSAVPRNAFVFETASFVIIVSILAHGLSDTVGTRWIERRTPPIGPRPGVEDPPGTI